MLSQSSQRIRGQSLRTSEPQRIEDRLPEDKTTEDGGL